MYLYYGNLVNFTSEPTYGTMSEARLTERVLAWVGEAQNIIDADYSFTVDYFYNSVGVAIDAMIKVQHKVQGVWVLIGYFSPAAQSLSSILATAICDDVCTPSPIVSQPIHYYVQGYYAPGYYI